MFREVPSGADPPAHVGRDTAKRVFPLFRPYRPQVVFVVALIVVTSTVGIVNPLLIQAVFNRVGVHRAGLLLADQDGRPAAARSART